MSKVKPFRQYRSNQGRSPQQVEGSYKAIAVSFLVLLVVLVGQLVYDAI
tara:strand:+ start:456 stop:602 length:147 start_codon:yes stop_codon:yes gene_type:complete